ncbi:MAG: tetratricopeptide repeat protein [Deltaproteobacteria bacterium]|nr:tetratricopeptide repeat protein [Deltaproteobacteria bacterium]
MTRRLPLLLLLLVAASGCVRQAPTRTSGTLEPPRPRPTRTVAGGETRIQSDLDPMLDLAVYDAQDLFEYGVATLEAENPGLARVAFARLLQEFPASPLAIAARYNLALAAERQGRLGDAADLYLEYVAVIEGTEPEEATGLVLHAGLLRWQGGDHPGSVVALRRALGSSTLDITERWEGRAILARIAGLGGDWAFAERELDSVRRGIRRYTRTTREVVPWSSAMVWFHAAEMYRDRAKAQRLLDVDDLPAARRWLDTTAGWFLESRRCHKRVLEHRHPEWSGRAALALGSINEEFRGSMLAADTPTSLDAEATVVYLGLLREQTRAFLEKAVEDYRWLLMDAHDLRVEGDALDQLRHALRRVEEQLETPDARALAPLAPEREP